MLPLAVSLPLLLLIAGIPAAYSSWRGRSLRRLADDGLLPDRLQAERHRNTFVTVFSVSAQLALGGWHGLWTIPLTAGLLLAADFPLRRQFFGETWTLRQYLTFWARWMLAFGGFWILLSVSPSVIWHSGAFAPFVAATAAAILVLWNARFDRVFLALLGAKRLTDATLVEAFRPVAERASAPAPKIWSADVTGGNVATAVALPRTGQGSVLFLQPLLDRFPVEEIVAVFAHEVGHLEQFTPLRLRVIGGVTLLTIAIAVLLPFVATRLASTHAGIWVTCWPAVVVALLTLRARFHRPLEFDSDRRAAVLCGNPEAVASALIRLHATARMPRRLDAETEQWQSHPSLARRVQALRALSGASVLPVHEPATFTTLEPAGTVTFESTGVRLPFGPDALTLYSHIHELRLDFKKASRPALVVREVDGVVRQVALREEDAAAVQAVLDRIDVLFAPALSSGANAAQQGALVALALSLVGFFWASSLSVFVTAALASFRASAPTLAAAAVAGLVGGAVLWWADGFLAPAAVLVLLGGILAVIAIRTWHSALDGPQRLMAIVGMLVLGLAVTVTWPLGMVIPGMTPVRLHRALAGNHALAVLPLGLAALLAAYPRSSPSLVRRVVRVGTLALLLVLGLVPVIAATRLFRERVVRDPLMMPAPRYEQVAATIDVRHRFRLGIHSDDIRLSPNGSWLSAAAYDESDSDAVRFTLVPQNGARLQLEAAELSFVDDEHVIAARGDESGIDLTAHRLVAGLPVVWRQRLPKFGLAQLDVSTPRHAWQAWGWAEDGAAVRFNGVVGRQEFEQRHWGGRNGALAEGLWFVGSGDYAIRLEGFELARPPSVWKVLAEGLGGRSFARGYRRTAVVDASGKVRPLESDLTVSCVAPPVDQPHILCSAFDGLETHVFHLGDRIVPVTAVRGALWLDEQHEDGTLTGTVDGHRVLIRPAAGKIVALTSDEDENWFEMTYANGLVAISSFGDEGQVIVGRLVTR